MKGLLNKKLSKKGFTLAELLIVVAILAILVAVSIPIFTSKLADAKKATDEANFRACKALVANAIISDEFPSTSWSKFQNIYSSVYDAKNGCLVPSVYEGFEYYGQGTSVKGYTNYDGTNGAAGIQWDDYANFEAAKDSYLFIYLSHDSGAFFIQWMPKE